MILKNAPILVLDEATSALDSEIEAASRRPFTASWKARRSSPSPTGSRPSPRMDRIVVLDRQKIAEIGTHDELLAKGGIYARFWKSQSGGFLGIDPAVQAGNQPAETGS